MEKNEKTTMDSVPETPAKDIQVIALSIDEDDDFGSDPYNRTGSHCVLEIDEAG